MPTAIINQSDCRIHLTGERLEVFGRNPATDRDETLREIPLRDLERLIISESVHITPPAMAALLSAGIFIQVYNEEVAFLHAHGLDPALGLLHATEDGRWSLALDLIEPFLMN